jgi:hypothetical protein
METNTNIIPQTEDVNTTFVEFFKTHKVEIPTIQRDYVQGSDLQKKKRNEFIDSLYDSLRFNEKPCELDFIYGTQNKDSFIPLDGQQRLTTLFLLHWYLLLKLNLIAPEESAKIREDISWNKMQFKYKTRRSSDAFCEKIINYFPDKIDSRISQKIILQSWFSDDWILDPTVSAMLDMIDALDDKFQKLKEPNPDVKQVLDNLLRTKSVTFDLLDMGKYKLNDSLYVKMNARGKQLTEFENWKAKFIRFLEIQYEKKLYKEAEDNRKRDYNSIKRYFTHSIEHEWTDLFWTYAIKDYKLQSDKYNKLSDDEKLKETIDNPLIDHYFLNFYHYIYRMCFFVTNKEEIDDEKENNLIGTEESRTKIFCDENNIAFLYQSLDLFVNIASSNKGGIFEFFENLFYIGSPKTDGRVRLFVSEKESSDYSVDLFDSCINDKARVDDQVMLYCIIRYCIKHKCYTATDNLRLFVRFCRNLLESINQRLKKDMKFYSNVRFSNLSKYEATIADICSKENLNDIESISAGMGDIDNAKKGLAYYSNPCMYYIEDSSYIHGSLYCFDLDTNIDDICSALRAFKAADDIDRSRILVAYAYKGTSFGYCSYGDRLFFGYRDRWDNLFRHKSGGESLKIAFTTFVEKYKNTPDIKKLIAERLRDIKETENWFAYYFLKYNDFANSSLWWVMDKDNKDGRKIDGHHFFAIKDDYDLITLPRFSSNPLKGYQTEPFACAVAQHLRRNYPDIYNNHLGNYTGENKNKAFIDFKDNNLQMTCTPNGWRISFSNLAKDGIHKPLADEKFTILKTLCKEDEQQMLFLEPIPGQDFVEVAVNFINEIYR